MAATRMRDTGIWDQEWYMNLPCRLKNLTDFVRDKCDFTGIWSPNFVIANAYIRPETPVTEADLLSIDEGRQFEKLPNGKIYCVDFIQFQYKTLSLESKLHVKVIELAKRNGIFERINHLIVEKSETMHAKRSRISEKLKRQIFAEDEYNCQYCGSHFSYPELVIDHIVPLNKGGDNENENLTTACISCNAKKWELDVFEFIERQNIIPLNSLNKKLNTLIKKLDSLKEIEKEEDKDKVKEKEKVKYSAQATIENQFGYTLTPNKALITDEILNDQIFVENLQMTHRGKNIAQAWEECWLHFTSRDHPPREVWEWKQKLNSWLSNKKAENGTSKTTSGNKNIDHIQKAAADFAARHGSKRGGGS
jgi:hypothetical protein